MPMLLEAAPRSPFDAFYRLYVDNAGVHRPADTHQSTSSPPAALSYAPDDLALPTSSGIAPVGVHYPKLVKQFNVSHQRAFLTQHDSLTQEMQRLQSEQPSFKAFVQAQLEQAFPDLRPLAADTISFNRYRSDGDVETRLSSEPLMKALGEKVRNILANPNTLLHAERKVRTEFTTRPTPADEPKTLSTSSSLQSIARAIATQYPAYPQAFWSTPRLTPMDAQIEKILNTPQLPKVPQDQLLSLHKQQLSTLAALRVSDGTLSPASKRLIDIALQYPTLADRERQFPNGARPGVYPITLDDGTEHGAMLAGSFLITSTDGCAATPPTWSKDGRRLALNDLNGPVVLYTPGEGFEEFATPAQARQALAARLDQGGIDAELLLQTAPLSVQNQPEAPSGKDLMRSVEPLSGDVLAEAIPLMLKRQETQINAHLAQALAPPVTGAGSNALLDPASIQSLDDAADALFVFDGTNAMLARDAKLAEKLQPQWLKTLEPVQAALFEKLEHSEGESSRQLASLLEKIPSLADFSRDRLNQALSRQYPRARLNADQLMVQVDTRTTIHSGRGSGARTTFPAQRSVSLTDLALQNPSGFPAVERGQFTHTTLTLPLVDTQGKPLIDAKGKQVILDTETLKTLVNTADVGGEYTKLLEQELAPDTASGPAAQLRQAWKANLNDLMAKESFLAELNPDAYQTEASQDKSTKRAAQWVAAVLDYPDPANRPQVDGKTIVANSLVQYGLPVQGVLVIGNQVDSSLVLYAPDAPDGVVFREVADQAALNTLLEKDEWTAYTARRKSPVNKDDFVSFIETAKKRLANPLAIKDPYEITSLAVQALKLKGGDLTLEPITGNVEDHLYKQHVQLVIDKADYQSVSSAEVAAQSKINKVEFGIEVGTLLLDLVPVLGKGLSAGARLGKAAVTALRANSQLLPHLIKNPGLGRGIYADFTLAAARIPNLRASSMRPVFNASTTAVANPIRPAARALPAPASPAPAIASTSRGVEQGVVQTPALGVAPSRDLSAYAKPDDIILGRQLGTNGTYNVDDNWYIRFTDSTGVNKVYQIDSAFHASSGQANIIDPNAPLTRSKSSRIVASVEHAGNGEWRLNRLPGGAPTPVANASGSGSASGSGGSGSSSASASGSQAVEAPASTAQAPAKQKLTDHEYFSITDGRLVENHFTPARLPVFRTWFRRDLIHFYRNMLTPGQMPPRPPRLELAPGTSPADLLRKAYDVTDIVILGESHREIASFQMIKECMPALKEAGVTTLYLENIELNAAGQLMDVGMGGHRPPGASPTLSELVKLANDNGITVRPIEHHYLTRRSDMPDFYKYVGDNDNGITRLQELNYFATRVIQKRKPGEKVLALVGRAHMNTARNVPGLAELNGGIGIGVYPNTSFSKSTAISGPSIQRDPGAGVADSLTVGDYQVFQQVT
ncbi:membrane-targeted effector domain-containing toxin [Pseudomonas synxantha]|uniref:membrane-targeted effector domain-containing toxin n=1 Tax=Pseudomonas synxantha TaxID=47883 RepID=UPI000A7D4A36|nr:membrane-targeted effector domain-containing toxin [Pseudomonas synxantha]